jgi:hypothetical protein
MHKSSRIAAKPKHSIDFQSPNSAVFTIENHFFKDANTGINRDLSVLTVSPTLGLDKLIEDFEKAIIEESDQKVDLAAAIMRWQNEKSAGKTWWGSERWMKDPNYYANLETPKLAEECFSKPIFAFETTCFENPRFGYERMKVFHNGFAELFKREDMWKGILHTYDYLSSKLALESDLKTIVETAGSLHALKTIYNFPTFKEQVKGREELLLAANIRVLKKLAWYLENYDPKQLGTDGSPGFFGEACSVAQIALMLTKEVDPQRYAAIKPTITGVRWSKKQNVQDLKKFLNLVITSLNGVVPDDGSP